MKICHVMTNFVRGGATKYIEDLVKGINAEHILVCGPGSDMDYVKEVGEHCRNTRIDRFLTKNPLLVLSFFTLLIYFRKERFDVVHTNSTPAGLAGRVAAKMAGCKVVHTNHAVPFEGRKSALILIAAEKLAGFCSDAIIDISPRIRKLFLAKSIGRGKHHTVPIGIDVERFKNAGKARVPGKGFKVVCVTRIVKGKGMEKLLWIARELPEASFIIVGDGPLRNSLEKAKPDNAYFLGFRNDVPKILKACDAFVLLSRSEGTPLTIFEAMTAGLPVISTKTGGVPDQVKNGKTGVIVRDEKEALDKIRVLMADRKKSRRMGLEGMKLVKSDARDRMVEKTRKIYESL